MSISITGMNMPKCCADCELLYDYMRCSVTATRADFEKMGSERLPNCPLKEIIDNTETVEKSEIWGDGFADGLAVGVKWVQRPQGKWVLVHPLQENDEGAYMCSVCHSGDWRISPEFEFCPYCGADMRGDKK